MTVFVSVLVFAFIVIAIYVGSHKLSGLQTAAALLVFLTGVTLVVSPTLAGTVAQFLGVGRGADLILYFCVVAGLFIAANFYFRIKAQEDMIVTIVREIALLTPREPRAQPISPGLNETVVGRGQVEPGGSVTRPG